jgi:hypothetical protein
MTFSFLETQKGRAPWWIARPFVASLSGSAPLAARRSDTVGGMAECRHGLLEAVTGEARRCHGANHPSPTSTTPTTNFPMPLNANGKPAPRPGFLYIRP